MFMNDRKRSVRISKAETRKIRKALGSNRLLRKFTLNLKKSKSTTGKGGSRVNLKQLIKINTEIKQKVPK